MMGKRMGKEKGGLTHKIYTRLNPPTSLNPFPHSFIQEMRKRKKKNEWITQTLMVLPFFLHPLALSLSTSFCLQVQFCFKYLLQPVNVCFTFSLSFSSSFSSSSQQVINTGTGMQWEETGRMKRMTWLTHSICELIAQLFIQVRIPLILNLFLLFSFYGTSNSLTLLLCQFKSMSVYQPLLYECIIK